MAINFGQGQGNMWAMLMKALNNQNKGNSTTDAINALTKGLKEKNIFNVNKATAGDNFLSDVSSGKTNILDIVKNIEANQATGSPTQTTGLPAAEKTSEINPLLTTEGRNTAVLDAVKKPFKGIYDALTYDINKDPNYNVTEEGNVQPIVAKADSQSDYDPATYKPKYPKGTKFDPITGQPVGLKYDPMTGQPMTDQEYYESIDEKPDPFLKYGVKPDRPPMEFADDDTTDQEFEEMVANLGVENYSDAQLEGLADLEAQGADIYGTGEVEEDPYMIDNYEAGTEPQGIPPVPPEANLVVDAFQNRFEAGDGYSATPDAEFEGDDMRAMDEIKNQELQDYYNNAFNRNNPMFDGLRNNVDIDSSLLDNLGGGGGDPLSDAADMMNMASYGQDFSGESFEDFGPPLPPDVSSGVLGDLAMPNPGESNFASADKLNQRIRDFDAKSAVKKYFPDSNKSFVSPGDTNWNMLQELSPKKANNQLDKMTDYIHNKESSGGKASKASLDAAFKREGAKGEYQQRPIFIEEVTKNMGFNNGKPYDPNDPEMARAATKHYLKTLMSRGMSIKEALASYNAGPTGMRKGLGSDYAKGYKV